MSNPPAFADPVHVTVGSADPGAPLVVLLHGRGSDEREIVTLAEQLPDGPAYTAVRAPIAEGGGYAWFANRGIGRPVAASLRATMDWFRGWLDDVAPPGRPVRPTVSSGIPQEQRSDTAPPELQEQVFAHIAALNGVSTGPSAISVPGARGFLLAPSRLGPDDAFIVPAVGEFAHLHPGHDGSLRLALPPALARDVVAKGWGVAHPLAGVRLTPGMVLLFGPRDTDEIETVVGVVTTAHAWASGQNS